MAKTVAELNAEIKKLEAARDEQIAKEKSDLLAELKSKIDEYKINVRELFEDNAILSNANFIRNQQNAASQKEEQRKERRTKEQVEADARAKFIKKLHDARSAFHDDVAVHRDGDKIFIEGQKGIKPTWMTKENLVKNIEELN